jgi:hypothetical protein
MEPFGVLEFEMDYPMYLKFYKFHTNRGYLKFLSLFIYIFAAAGFISTGLLLIICPGSRLQLYFFWLSWPSSYLWTSPCLRLLSRTLWQQSGRRCGCFPAISLPRPTAQITPPSPQQSTLLCTWPMSSRIYFYCI